MKRSNEPRPRGSGLYGPRPSRPQKSGQDARGPDEKTPLPCGRGSFAPDTITQRVHRQAEEFYPGRAGAPTLRGYARGLLATTGVKLRRLRGVNVGDLLRESRDTHQRVACSSPSVLQRKRKKSLALVTRLAERVAYFRVRFAYSQRQRLKFGKAVLSVLNPLFDTPLHRRRSSVSSLSSRVRTFTPASVMSRHPDRSSD